MASLSCFSTCGEYFAISDSTLLKIFETTGELKYTVKLSSNLSVKCCCLSWCPEYQRIEQSAKSQKSKTQSDLNNSPALAVGTLNGDVLLYNIPEIIPQTLNEGHTEAINDISWHPSSHSLFSCSNDTYIVHWNFAKETIIRKWKADRNPIFAIQVLDENNLLSANTTIKWWDLQKKALLKKFSGHTENVFQLLPILNNSVEGGFFISAAHNDECLKAWNLTPSANKLPVVSFKLSHEPVTIHCTKEETNKPRKIVAVTKNGIVQVFEHDMKEHSNKSLNPKTTLRVTSNSNKVSDEEGDSDEKGAVIPVLSTHFLSSNTVMIVYGDITNPVIEKVVLKNQSNITLLRKLNFLSSNKEKQASIVKNQPTVQLHRTYLQSSLSPKTKNSLNARKRKNMSEEISTEHENESPKTDSTPSETNLLDVKEELLPEPSNLQSETCLDDDTVKDDTVGLFSLQLYSEKEDLDMEINEDITEEHSSPTRIICRSMTELLMKGLNEHNESILNELFQHDEEYFIVNIIKDLPILLILQLCSELYKRLHSPVKNFISGYKCLRWLKNIFKLFLTDLKKYPDIEHIFVPVNDILITRAETWNKLSRLKGRLDLLSDQFSKREENVNKQKIEDNSSEEDFLSTGELTEADEDSEAF